MAGRPKKPIALHIANGNPSKLTDEEIEERKATELHVPFVNVTPPDYLNAKQKAEFNEIAGKLVGLGIFTELDEDALGRYLLAKELWLAYTKELKKMLNDNEADLRDIASVQQLQDKAFRQCVTGANELCLNVTSRAKMVIPKPPEEDEEL